MNNNEDGTIDAQIIANFLVAILSLGFGSLFGILLLIHTQTQISAYMRSIDNDMNRAHPNFLYLLQALYYIVSLPERTADYLRHKYANIKQQIRDYQDTGADLPILKEIARLNLKDLLDNNADLPPNLSCPISKGLLVDPVLTPAGIIYNRREIQDWYDRGYYRDPMTNAELSAQARKILITNQNKTEQVLLYLQEEAQRRELQRTTTANSQAAPAASMATPRTTDSLVNVATQRRQQQIGELFLASYTQRQAAANQANNIANAEVDLEIGSANDADHRTPLLQHN